MSLFHEIQHPDGRHRIQFFRDKSQTWRYECLDLVKKRWRKNPDGSQSFDSYAAALVAAKRETPWIMKALSSSDDSHVELLRGLPFHFHQYEADYGYHDHCSACWKKLVPMGAEVPETEHEGYVTRYEIPDGSKQWQWNWVCTDCFKRLHESMQWEER